MLSSSLHRTGQPPNNDNIDDRDHDHGHDSKEKISYRHGRPPLFLPTSKQKEEAFSV